MTRNDWRLDRRAPLPPAPPWSGASEKLVASPDHPWRTPAEAADFETTPGYGETWAYLARLAAASSCIRLTSFGRSASGRDLPLVVASRDPDALLAGKVQPGKPRLLVQCGIHPGEIDGKDAGLMLLRDIAFGKAVLLDGADWLFVPILNPDGHERASPFNRPNQRGPLNQGWRASAQGLNLNRDYMKLDSPEMTALVGLINRIEPDLYIDLHVTDGLDYQYDITYGFQDGPYSASPCINAWLETSYRPAIDAALAGQGHIPGPLILARDDRAPEQGLYLPAFPPRFSHGYGDLRHLPTVLVENHSLKPVRQRVLGTYLLLEASLKLLGEAAADLRAATRADRAARPDRPVLRWADRSDPVRHVPFHPIAHEYYLSPASGAQEVRWTGRPAPATSVPLFGSQPELQAHRPHGYWVPASEADVIERLRRHGIAFTLADAPMTAEVEMIRFGEVEIAPRISERRISVIPKNLSRERRTEVYAPGSAFVPTDQPLGDLAIMLLEPESRDSLFAMGFITGMLDRIAYLEAYVIAPLADRMLTEDEALRRRFEEKLARDPDFAADPAARLDWFYRQTPYEDERYLLYPVGRVTA